MIYLKSLALIGIIFGVLAVAGCGSGNGALTQEQTDAMRYPKADPNHKPASKENMTKMQQQIAAFRQAHANDKPIQFTH